MATAQAAPMTAVDRKVIFASSLGTVFEWYDFYLFGSLYAVIGKQFVTPLNDTSQTIFAFLAFAAGFAVRPVGAIVFGRIGDLIGRKYTFLITIMFMGLSTFVVGLLPNYDSIGIAAPIILILVRLIQGLALGGEYGGAATYVAEHAPQGKRGAYTSWIQTTATVGLLLSLLIILACRSFMSDADFVSYGWRIPFLVSIFLLVISVWIRLSLAESPAFRKMKAEGKGSTAPLTDSFARWSNLKIVILALLGLTAGEAVVWYAGQFYALIFLGSTLKVEPVTTNLLIAAALVAGTPFFVIFGTLSDKIGRKPILLAGFLLASLTYFPIFEGITHYANPALEAAQQKNPVKVYAAPGSCHFQFEFFAKPTGKPTYTDSCDLATSILTKASVTYTVEPAPEGTIAYVTLGENKVESFEGGDPMTAADFKKAFGDFGKKLGDQIKAAGYPAKADLTQMNKFMVWVLLTILVIYVTMVYGPIAAALVEMFPTRIRYTSMSLPYHIGNGWLGGFLPTITFAMVALKGDIYYGLWYPIIVSAFTFVVCLFFVKESKDVDIFNN